MTDNQVFNYRSFYVSCLHEIGHVLGLGHIDSDNVMRQGIKKEYEGLQDGDIRRIIEIYGAKEMIMLSNTFGKIRFMMST